MVLDQSLLASHVILTQYYRVTCVMPMQHMQDAPIHVQVGNDSTLASIIAEKQRRMAMLPQRLNAALLFLDTLRGTKRRRKVALYI